MGTSLTKKYPKCKVEGCDSPGTVRKMCKIHYWRWHRHGDPTVLLQAPPGTNVGKICKFPACQLPVRGKGYCVTHLQRIYMHGDPSITLVGPKGSWARTAAGYLVSHRGGKLVYQHIWKIEQILGKPLPKGAVVHHLNGNPADNRNCNLLVCPSQEYHFLIHKRQEQLGYKGPSL